MMVRTKRADEESVVQVTIVIETGLVNLIGRWKSCPEDVVGVIDEWHDG